MLKHVLMASAMMISVPALAQGAPVQDNSVPAGQVASDTGQASSGSGTPVDPAQDTTQQAETTAQTMPTQPTPTEPVPTAPVQSAETPAPMDAGQEAPVQAADATAPEPAPAASGNQVADVVNAEFPTYDKDADGQLKSEEFGQWMIALRSASDPSTDAQSAEVKRWVDQAFASADADKSKSVDKTELTGFLSQGAS